MMANPLKNLFSASNKKLKEKGKKGQIA